ncbi:two-component system VirA-like sensor kinase [Aurantimonas sp. 22II-16-19i]|uniref:two-component system VirA-like sensor kinase n=1 Tax=Aurantimonas sp. 22II-16-19i TaxID=1317114 RepID=UPI0009F7C8B7|nr:two-component system VirA-like sensor kinase [Aurantimonas sp. 22II-16-19i]ORE90343.1 two-component VirA-like sensor kinase [Aurantimonas sp. 22II-16-19i]
MNRLQVFLGAAAGMLVILTTLFVLSMTPNDARHQKTLEALRAIDTSNASLQRDVLQARSSILHNYDPLVRSLAVMQRSSHTLDEAVGGEDAQLARIAVDLDIALDRAGELIERFKSKNSVMQNSQIIFGDTLELVKRGLPSRNGEAHMRLTGVAGTVSRFTREPSPENQRRLNLALNRLQFPFLPEFGGHLARTLIIHGRVLANTFPIVDAIAADLQRVPTAVLVQRYQARYLALHAEALDRAAVFRVVLYGIALILCAYVAYLFVRLQQNAATLRDRLALEAAIATVSTRLIDMDLDHLCQEMEAGLAILGRSAGLDEVRVFPREEVPAGALCPAGQPGPDDGAASVFRLAEHWDGSRACHGGIEVAKVSALPIGGQRNRLERLGYRSWLALPLQNAERNFGYLSFATLSRERRWPADEVALLRTAAEIFTNALQRAHGDRQRALLEARLAESQRLESLGTLAGGIAHEYNNILGAILGYGELALSELDADGTPHRQVQQIVRAGMRAQSITDQILAFSRRRDNRYRPMRTVPAVSEALELVRASLPGTITIQTRFADGEGVILGDPAELQQVVMNLCANAAHAMDREGVVELAVDEVAVARDRELSHGRLKPGRYVRLAVRDRGHGMSAETLNRLFEPFFTTKSVGEGTGLGLSAVHGIVTAHKGTLDVSSEIGKGSSIEAYFPRSDLLPIEEEDAAALDRDIPRGNGETILVVDADRQRRTLLEEMLAHLGYEAVGFGQTQTALDAVARNNDRFDLALLDEAVIDPGLQHAWSGPSGPLARLPVLVIAERGSGDGRREWSHTFRMRLEKPLRMEALAMALSHEIQRDSTGENPPLQLAARRP